MTFDSFAKPSPQTTALQSNFRIVPQTAASEPLIDDLLDRTFGTERQERTVYRLRKGLSAVESLSFMAVSEDGDLIASLRFWPVAIAGKPAILLGPLAVEPKHQGLGMGRSLVAVGLKAAKQQGHALCLVVGDPAYYAPYGFIPACPNGLILPGPVAPERFQALELVAGAIEGVRGLVERAPEGSTTEGRKPKRSVVA
ncbi:GNAT family N-acetyltransferase [Denitrobaculum tricleocarpae]|uniref:N-acetyltransferase n=1 Tax=Denitrobaculum tricleocarpae TaxID=2591009 RepID=A0A545U225_9PROT|nr:N-acetyltransferase [Denitrobaculum tricleocarpae]TQV83530.1 N-acetyltransferase [Denitrobaculum tricleocarpae]